MWICGITPPTLTKKIPTMMDLRTCISCHLFLLVQGGLLQMRPYEGLIDSGISGWFLIHLYLLRARRWMCRMCRFRICRWHRKARVPRAPLDVSLIYSLMTWWVVENALHLTEWVWHPSWSWLCLLTGFLENHPSSHNHGSGIITLNERKLILEGPIFLPQVRF